MIAYPKPELSLLEIRSTVLDATSQELISKEESRNILMKYPSRFYSPNMYIRIGLGLLTILSISSISSFFGLLLDFRNAEIILLLTALGCLAMLEYFIQTKHHYRSGIDDTLLHSAIAFLLIFTGIETESSGRANNILLSLAGLALYTIASIRYLDRMALIGALASLAFFCFAIWEKSSPNMALLPCWTITLALAAIAVTAHQLKDRPVANYHRHLLILLENLAVVGAYASLHILTIDAVLTAKSISTSAPAPQSLSTAAAIFYWSWTLIVPVLMLKYALRQQESLSIRLSLLAILSALYAQHHFFPVFEPELAAVIYGLLLLLAGWWTIRFLKNDNSVYSFRHGGDEGDLLGQNPFLVVAGFAGTGTPTDTPPISNTNFGGGSFGGAGAGTDF